MILTNEFYLGIIVGLGGIFSFTAFIFSCLALIKTIATEKSTHTMQYMPISEQVDKENEEFVKKEQWATKESSINEQNQAYKDDLESDMPDFAEFDKEITSF